LEIVEKIKERGGKVSENMNIVLEWFDTNDLNMTVKCPCNVNSVTHLNKGCTKCQVT